MQRIFLKRIEKYFETSKYTLVIYYHKDLSIKDIYNRVIKKESKLADQELETGDRCEAIVLTDDDGICYLVINSKVSIGTIQHEAVHIASAAFDFMGVKHVEATDEPYAYLTQHIFEFILTTLLHKLQVPVKNLLTFN